MSVIIRRVSSGAARQLPKGFTLASRDGRRFDADQVPLWPLPQGDEAASRGCRYTISASRLSSLW
jgi:hypothetical protein